MSVDKALILFSLSLAIAVGQTGNSTITGDVKDASGAPIPLVKIKVVNVETGSQQETASNDAGVYRVGALLPGSYRLEAESPGFDHLTRTAITMQVGQTLGLDLTLQVGQQTETVNVV